MATDKAAYKIEVNGIVQGVGFRPFVHQLAARLDLKGFVANTSAGVHIHLEGPLAKIRTFEQLLAQSPPPLADITEMRINSETCRDFADFRVTASQGQNARATLISPDVCTCDDCLRELFDPADRRFRYPFINCTNCGPRYTIIDDIPYDRPNTSMKRFAMCEACQAEYDDPANRRFHAQPNACPVCGPQVMLTDMSGKPVAGADSIQKAIELLQDGAILAIKGLGGFHLAVNPADANALWRLRENKQREEKPFALMARDLATIRRFARISGPEQDLLTSLQRPIVLLTQKDNHLIDEAVAPRNRYYGVMLPYTPLHFLLLTPQLPVLVMTSANPSQEPLVIDNQEAFERLTGIADYGLVHDRDIYLRSDDSIVRHAAGGMRILRRSRGYVPRPVFLKTPLAPVLACGAELKSTICLTRANQAFVSQHIGDLENMAAYRFFQDTIAHLKRILDIRPEIIAHDLHPDYLSTQYALAQTGMKTVGVQHHHAHIASVMAEHHIEAPVIGLALDGTGFGPDHCIWGGEVLLARISGYTRLAHLDYIRMPGGGAAIKAPWRMALAHLHAAFEDPSRVAATLPGLSGIDAGKRNTIFKMISQRINAPQTSSLGRLFDAVAAMTGIRDQVSYEGQAAMELEMAADPDETGFYPFTWSAGPVHRIDTRPMIRGIVAHIRENRPVPVISACFHNTLVKLFAELCKTLRQDTGIEQVALGGGVFQNALLLTRLTAFLSREGFQVYTNERVPANDGGLCLGQAAIAGALAKSRSAG